MKKLAVVVVALLAAAAFAGEPTRGVGRLNHVQFNWTAVETKTALVVTLDKRISLRPVQVERLRHLPAGPIVRADDVVGGELSSLTLSLNGNVGEALAQATRMIPGLTLRIVPKEEKVDNPKRIIAEYR